MKDGSGALAGALAAGAVGSLALPAARGGGPAGAGFATLSTTLTRPPPRQAGAVDARAAVGSGVVGDIGGLARETFAAGSTLTAGDSAAGADRGVVTGFVSVADGGGGEAGAFSGSAVEGAVAGTADDDGADGDDAAGDGAAGEDAGDDGAGGDGADDDGAADDGAGVAATGFLAAGFFAADGTDADDAAAGATSFAGGATVVESAGGSRSPCTSAVPAGARRRRGLPAAGWPALLVVTAVPALAALSLPVAAVFVVRLRGARLAAALISMSPAAVASGSVATFLRGVRLRGAAFAGGAVLVPVAGTAPLSPAGVAGAVVAAALSAGAAFLRAARLRGGLTASSFMTEF